MDLRYRLTELDDIDQCLSLVPPERAYPAALGAQAAQTLRSLAFDGLLNSMVMEDFERPPDSRIVGFGISVFVTPDYMALARHNATPGLNVQFLDAVIQGKSPQLDHKAIRAANSGDGLNVLVLHSRETTHALNAEEQRRIQEKWIETFLYVHGGYQLREMLLEVQGERNLQFVLGTGARLRSAYEAYYQTQPTPPDRKLALVGISREENAVSPGQYATTIFHYAPPRCFFNTREQELLQRALREETDDEMAQSLGLSLSAVKKRWNMVYARVAALDPPLLPLPALSVEAEPKRGQEKRRHLLRYLRQHPEELRPTHAPSERPK